MKIKIWGCRGSLPSPHHPKVIEDRIRSQLSEFIKAGYSKESEILSFLQQLPRQSFGGFGGNTTCIEIKTQSSHVIIDSGSGIRPLGYQLLEGPCGKGKGEVHLLLSHFHWDHLIGLPFFVPIFIPGNTIHVYAVQPELEDAFKVLFRKPYFPVNLKDLGAKIIYHQLSAREPLKMGDLSITPYQLDHPDPCYGFKCENNGKVYSHCFDTECTRFTREELGDDLPLYQKVDLMLWDAQYTLIESIEKVHWGHASSILGLDLAIREGIKKIVFVHHDPASSDEKISTVEAQTRRYYETQRKNLLRDTGQAPEVQWDFAFEGMEFDL